MNIMLDFTAGCLGGIAGVIVGHPLDTIKVHLQTQSSSRPIYHGIWHCGTTLWEQNGLRGLYRGITSPMAGVGVVNAILFGIYGNVQRQFSTPDSLYAHGGAGAIAGLVQSFVCSPVELAKTRLQLQSNNNNNNNILYKSPTSCMWHIINTEGIRGTARGLFCTICRDVPSMSVYFVSYEWMMRQPKKPQAWHSFLAGGFAGMLSWVVCYPTDVIKSCIQADGMNGTFKYNGIMDCIKHNYKNDGIHFFFRGFNSTIIRAFPVNAACFFIVALFLRVFRGKGIDVTVHSNEPMVLMCLDRPIDRSFGHVHDNDYAIYELQRKRALMRSSLVFNEVISNSDVDDIVNEFYPEYNRYFHTIDEHEV